MWNELLMIGTVYAQAAPVEEEPVNPFIAGLQGLFANLPLWVTAIFLLLLFYLLARIGASKVHDYLTKQQEEYMSLETHKGVIILAERMTFLVIFVVGVLFALTVSNLMSDLGWLLGSLGLAIGFALQGFVINFVSGIMLLAQEKTKLGNFVEVQTIKGIIKEIGLRATLVQRFDGVQVLIPNRMFFDNSVTIFTANEFRRTSIPVGVAYGTDLERATAIIMEIMNREEKIIKDRPNGILVKAFKETGIELSVRFWTKSRDPWWRIKSNMIHQIKVEFDREHIVLAPIYIYKEV